MKMFTPTIAVLALLCLSACPPNHVAGQYAGSGYRFEPVDLTTSTSQCVSGGGSLSTQPMQVNLVEGARTSASVYMLGTFKVSDTIYAMDGTMLLDERGLTLGSDGYAEGRWGDLMNVRIALNGDDELMVYASSFLQNKDTSVRCAGPVFTALLHRASP